MANRTGKSVSTAEYFRILERREKKIRVKQLLCSDSFEARMYDDELRKVQHMIKMLNRVMRRHTAGGIETAALGMPIETAVLM